MPAHPITTNFTSGEISDRLIGRVDVAKVQNGARCLKNFIVQVQGGATRRAGTIYMGSVKFPGTQRVRLVRFEFSRTQAYVLEFGGGYIRFWANRGQVVSGGIPVEVAAPYLEADLRALRFEQSADVLYIAHPDYAPRKLQRLSATSFQLSVISFLPPPTFEQEIEPAATLTLDAPSGLNVGVTASASVFMNGDIGRQILSGTGRAAIITFTSATQVRVNIIDAFASTTLAQGDWTMDGSANAGTATPTDDAPVNAYIDVNLSLDGFRTTDVGKYIYLNNGIVRILNITSATQANGQIVKVLSVTTAAPAGSWTVESPQWSADLGFPGVVCLHNQRLWWAGSSSFPDTVWGSVIGDYENHAGGAADDDAVEFTIASSGVNMIRWMKGGVGLLLGTIASELTMEGTGDEIITASNVRVKDRTTYGADFAVDAIRAGSVVLFLQRAAKRIREFTFSFEADTYVAPDMLILSEHLTREFGIVEMAYAGAPESLLFAARSDGVLLAMTYERPENVVAWSHHETDGDYESIAVIPNPCGSGDEVWTSVNRPVVGGHYWHANYWHADYWHANYWALGGQTERRTVEVFDGGMNTDAGLVYAGVAASTFTGLTHLEGKTVKAIDGDGTVYTLVVSGGAITLPGGATATALEVGLPFVSTLQTIRPELATQVGTAQGRLKRLNKVGIRLLCTEGTPLINGEPVVFPDQAEFPFTGDISPMTEFGWDREGQVVFQQSDPKPCTVLAVMPALQVDDG